MRVTTQMLNRSAAKAGIPSNGTSLLNYVKGGGNSNSGALMKALQSKKAGAVQSADAAKYGKLGKAAEKLGQQADRLAEEGEESLLGKAQASGDYTAVYKEIGTLVDRYNSAISILESVPGVMNDFYRRNMLELAAGNKEALESAGISIDRKGRLEVDQEKLEAADQETIEKLFGKEGGFASKLSFLAGRIEDNAESSRASMSGGYSAKGNSIETYFNRYDYRG